MSDFPHDLILNLSLLKLIDQKVLESCRSQVVGITLEKTNLVWNPLGVCFERVELARSFLSSVVDSTLWLKVWGPFDCSSQILLSKTDTSPFILHANTGPVHSFKLMFYRQIELF